MPKTLISERAVVLAKLQTAVGSPATPTSVADAILVSEPDYEVDPSVLERNFVRNDFSPFPHLIGRKLAMMSFTAEVRGNGKQHSGAIADQPKLARLLAACGYALSELDGDATNIQTVVADSKNPATNAAVTFAGTATAIALTLPVVYTIEVTAANAAKVYSNSPGDPIAAAGNTVVFTSGTKFALGTSGAELTPTFGTAPAVGSAFRVLVLPTGIAAKQISEDQPAITLWGYFDGKLHKVTDCHGTFTINAEAGDYATIEFTFTGQYVPTTDAVMPADAVYEETLPSQVELSNLTWGKNRELVVANFTYDQANTITPRPDVNGTDGYRGVRITGRAPSGGIDPEATLAADEDFWGDFADARAKTFYMNIGTQRGNIVALFGPVVQQNELGYGDRDGIRTHDVGLLFKRNKGNDEFSIFFC